MRFEELAYAVDGGSVTVQFHARLTVVSVEGAGEREAWIAGVLGVLEGMRPGDGASLVAVDRGGRRIRLERDENGAAILTDLATGAEVPYAAGHLSLDGRFDWFASAGVTSRVARELMVVTRTAFTAGDDDDDPEAEVELKKARAQLAEVEAKHRAAITRRAHLDDLNRRLADLEGEIRREEEAAAAAAEVAGRAAEDWRVAALAADDARRAVGSRPRLAGEALDQALTLPVEVPADLETLAKACRAAAERRDALVTRLAGDASDPTGEGLRWELVEEVEPAYVDALAQLADACRPFGVSIDAARLETAGVDARGIEVVVTEVQAEVATRAAQGRHARLQQALEEAESALEALERNEPPRSGRSPSPSPLVAERAKLRKEAARTGRGLPDPGPLAERQTSLEARIAELEADHGTARPAAAVAEAEAVLGRRAAEAARGGKAGRQREPLPLIVDDAFAPFRAEHRRALLDVLAELGETTQIVYLTDDPDTLAWASEMVATGDVACLPAQSSGSA